IPAQHYGGAVARLAVFQHGRPLATPPPDKRQDWMGGEAGSTPGRLGATRALPARPAARDAHAREAHVLDGGAAGFHPGRLVHARRRPVRDPHGDRGGRRGHAEGAPQPARELDLDRRLHVRLRYRARDVAARFASPTQRRMKRALLALLAGALASAALAQSPAPDVPPGPARIGGVLRRAENGEPVAGAEVALYALTAEGVPGLR